MWVAVAGFSAEVIFFFFIILNLYLFSFPFVLRYFYLTFFTNAQANRMTSIKLCSIKTRSRHLFVQTCLAQCKLETSEIILVALHNGF